MINEKNPVYHDINRGKPDIKRLVKDIFLKILENFKSFLNLARLISVRRKTAKKIKELIMDIWLRKILVGISEKYQINREKSKMLLDKLKNLMFNND